MCGVCTVSQYFPALLLIVEVTVYFRVELFNRSVPSSESAKAANSVTNTLQKYVLQLGKNIFQMYILQFVYFTGLNIQIMYNNSNKLTNKMQQFHKFIT
jgi:hypothetical protein